jgi:outer membrane protein TolC
MRPYRAAVLLLAITALLSGCAGAPPARPAITPQASAQALQHRSLFDSGLQRFLAAQTGVRQTLRWTPHRLTLAALYFHPDLRVARASVQLAAADLRIAQQRSNPSLQLELKYGGAAALAAPSPWTVGAAIGMLLQSQSQRAAQTAQARAALRAAQLLLRAARWQVRSRVLRAAVALWAAQRQVCLQRQALATALALQQRIAARALAGIDPPLGEARAQQTTQQAALRLSRDLAAMRAARIAVAQAIGVPIAALRHVRLDLSTYDRAPPGPVQTQLVRAALRTRDDIRAAWQRVRAAQAVLQMAQSRQAGGLPSIAPGAERDQGVDRLTLGVCVPLPLFNQQQGEIAAARARLAQRQAQLQQLQAQVLARIELALAALRAAQQQTLQSAGLVAAARAQWQADIRARSRGWLGPIPALRARLRLLADKGLELRSRAAQWQAAVSLQAALQRRVVPAPDRIAAAAPLRRSQRPTGRPADPSSHPVCPEA